MEYSSDELRRLLEEETDLSDLEVFELALAKSPANLETDFLMLKDQDNRGDRTVSLSIEDMKKLVNKADDDSLKELLKGALQTTDEDTLKKLLKSLAEDENGAIQRIKAVLNELKAVEKEEPKQIPSVKPRKPKRTKISPEEMRKENQVMNLKLACLEADAMRPLSKVSKGEPLTADDVWEIIEKEAQKEGIPVEEAAGHKTPLGPSLYAFYEQAKRKGGFAVEKEAGTPEADKVWAKIEKKAYQLVQKDHNLTFSKAVSQVLETNPSLYSEYERALQPDSAEADRIIKEIERRAEQLISKDEELTKSQAFQKVIEQDEDLYNRYDEATRWN